MYMSICGRVLMIIRIHRLLTAHRLRPQRSVDCQKAQWKEHKARCKEVQAAKAAT